MACLLFLALTDERGNLIWIFSARRGAASEIKTARHDKICQHLRTAGLGALADLGFVGLDIDRDNPVVITGAKRTRKKKLTAGAGQKTANQIIAAARAPVEHGSAALKTGASSPGCGSTRPGPRTCCAPCSS
uniref:Transposase family protein n=1 Tax=Streptomyces sp. NBC_00003 TaxID=2903608 RepID=A0AAU2UZH4_9ACTN